MTPAQRLAEWKQYGFKQREYEVTYNPLRQRYTCNLACEKTQSTGTGRSADEAITAALDAWQKGDG